MPAITTQSEAQEWYKIVTNWPQYWDNFQRNYRGLLAQSNYITTKHPEMRGEYDKLVDSGSKMYQRMLAVDQTVNAIKNTWGEFTGWLKGAVGLQGLGFIPVAIGAAAAASLIYSVSLWIRDASQHARKLELMKDLEAKGMSPGQAANEASKFTGSGDGTLFGIDIKWLVIGGIALMVLPSIIPMLRKST